MLILLLKTILHNRDYRKFCIIFAVEKGLTYIITIMDSYQTTNFQDVSILNKQAYYLLRCLGFTHSTAWRKQQMIYNGLLSVEQSFFNDKINGVHPVFCIDLKKGNVFIRLKNERYYLYQVISTFCFGECTHLNYVELGSIEIQPSPYSRRLWYRATPVKEQRLFKECFKFNTLFQIFLYA